MGELRPTQNEWLMLADIIREDDADLAELVEAKAMGAKVQLPAIVDFYVNTFLPRLR